MSKGVLAIALIVVTWSAWTAADVFTFDSLSHALSRETARAMRSMKDATSYVTEELGLASAVASLTVPTPVADRRRQQRGRPRISAVNAAADRTAGGAAEACRVNGADDGDCDGRSRLTAAGTDLTRSEGSDPVALRAHDTPIHAASLDTAQEQPAQ